MAICLKLNNNLLITELIAVSGNNSPYTGLGIIGKEDLMHIPLALREEESGIMFPRKFRIAHKVGHRSRQMDLFVEYLLNYSL